MVAENRFVAHARPWLVEHQPQITRALAMPIAVCGAWWFAATPLPSFVWSALIVYALVQLVLLRRVRQAAGRAVSLGYGLALATNAGLALFVLLYQAILPPNGIYPIFSLIALHTLAIYQQLPVAILVPFLLGPTYLFSQALQQPTPASTTWEQQAQWVLLLSSLGFGVAAIWLHAAQQRINQALRQSLHEAHGAAELRIAQMERIANDLRARMREQYALEEGLRVVTSTLSLDDVLSQIVDSAIQVLGADRVQGIVLSLEDDGVFEHRTSLYDDAADGPWKDLLANRTLQQQVPLIINDVLQDSELAPALPYTIRSALSVPLYAAGGAPRGTLTVVSTERSAFSSGDARHMIAFAMQAGIAIGNAEMHSRIRQQQDLLESVMHDMSDGLVVVDAQQEVVLTNPLGRALLDRHTTTVPVREQLLGLAASVHASTNALLTSEIHLEQAEVQHEEAHEAYLALASQVRQSDGSEPLTAIVLHDITSQKAEEHARTEFISMVAHELRNPLNSLNGFVKIVLQGRAGPLNEMQREFLEIADNQIERLKGRISELLEFNRLEAGRLVLNPQVSDLPMLVASTLTRLSLQAEQSGIQLINAIRSDFPECVFDAERVGQVITNLVENAFKATPPGGSVTLSAAVHNDEIHVRVQDTGVGISAEDHSKIFQAFYRAHDRASSHGNHLGLGLAICKQIIDGHQGRIWVESEEGKGTSFTFALPLHPMERAVNEA